jgi:hypothetical protein
MRFTYFVKSLNTNSDFEAKSWTAKLFLGIIKWWFFPIDAFSLDMLAE